MVYTQWLIHFATLPCSLNKVSSLYIASYLLPVGELVSFVFGFGQFLLFVICKDPNFDTAISGVDILVSRNTCLWHNNCSALLYAMLLATVCRVFARAEP